MIDIDRNGHFSPARVECKMSSQGIETSIANNLPLEYVSTLKGCSQSSDNNEGNHLTEYS